MKIIYIPIAALLTLLLLNSSCNFMKLRSGGKISEAILNCYPNTILDKDKSSTLLMLSAEGCGYCHLAKKSLKKYNISQVIVLEFDGQIGKQRELYQSFQILDGRECEFFKNKDWFPEFYLFNSTGNTIWNKKGWTKETKDYFENNFGFIDSF